MTTPAFTATGAHFSPCLAYRYELRRTWQQDQIELRERKPQPSVCLFVMLNPSTADAVQLDPTVRRCVGFANDWGFSTLLVGNLFALRSTDPRALYDHPDPIGPHNNIALESLAKQADMVVAAWGNHGALHDRGRLVLEVLAEIRTVHCLGLTQSGSARHPLYLPKATQPEVLRAWRSRR